MVPVLDQVLTDDDIGPIDHQLELAGVPHSVSAGKVLVPADRKGEILANLMFARVLPQDTHSAFETMSKEINPFMPNSQVEMAYSEATAMELSSLISRFPGVANARVIINAKDERRIEGSIPPSATVVITTKGEAENAKTLVRAAADGVAHAVSGLKPSQISVIINGASMKVPDSESSADPNIDDLMDRREKRESDLEQKIRNEFSFIGVGLTVSVNCDVENRVMVDHTVKYDKAGTVVQPIETTSTNDESTTASAAAHEPGAVSNTGQAGTNGPVSIDGGGAGASGAGGNSTTSTKDEAKNGVWVGQSEITTQTPAGKDSVQSVTVRVPASYFNAIYKRKNPSATDAPDDFINLQLASIKDGVKKVVGLKSDDALSVDSYADLPVNDLAMATAPSIPSSAMSSVGGHAKEIGVGVLAIVSLLMMATMVRKSTPPQLGMPSPSGQPASATAGGLGQLGSGESIAGEVGAGAGALDGMEMDEEAVRTQQMLDQVSTMVKENPDGAASLVKKWLSRP
jgi:flagellar biosynthesis/type III secretory pathway M-ring protein FliF/YscJ